MGLKAVPVAEIERIIDDLETRCQTELEIAKGYDHLGNPKFMKHTSLAEGYKYAAEELKKIL